MQGIHVLSQDLHNPGNKKYRYSMRFNSILDPVNNAEGTRGGGAGGRGPQGQRSRGRSGGAWPQLA